MTANNDKLRVRDHDVATDHLPSVDVADARGGAGELTNDSLGYLKTQQHQHDLAIQLHQRFGLRPL